MQLSLGESGTATGGASSDFSWRGRRQGTHFLFAFFKKFRCVMCIGQSFLEGIALGVQSANADAGDSKAAGVGNKA